MICYLRASGKILGSVEFHLMQKKSLPHGVSFEGAEGN